MNLYEQLRADMAENSEFWNCDEPDFVELFQNEDAVRGFIFRFLKKHVGEAVTEHLYQHEYKEQAMKNAHTVYVFFLGAMFRNIFDDELAIESKVVKPYTFAYLWSLISMGHDIGYLYEMNSRRFRAIPECWHSVYFKNVININNNIRLPWYRSHGLYIYYTVPGISRHKVNGNCCLISCEFECERPIVFSNQTVLKRYRYSNRMKDDFFRYQWNENGILDHGIVGADVLYSGLLEWYILNYRKSNKIFQSFENEWGEHFCCEQLNIYIYIANCVAGHNIGIATDRKWAKGKMSYKEDPLLFLLCIADIIEPSKRLKDFTAEEIFKGIAIHYNKDRRKLFVEVSSYIAEVSYGKLYMQDILRLSEYCEIRIFVQVKTP